MNCRVFIGNLSYKENDDTFRVALVELGYEPANVKVVMDKDTGRCRGFAFVEMPTETAAKELIKALDGHTLLGRRLRATEAIARSTKGPSRGPSSQQRPRQQFATRQESYERPWSEDERRDRRQRRRQKEW